MGRETGSENAVVEMTPREEILKLAHEHKFYGEFHFNDDELESFYRATFAAGQAEMRERAATLTEHYYIGLASEIRALPIGENE